jgi:hypothetical protein
MNGRVILSYVFDSRQQTNIKQAGRFIAAKFEPTAVVGQASAFRFA